MAQRRRPLWCPSPVLWNEGDELLHCFVWSLQSIDSHSQCSGDSKQNSVIVHLLHSIVLEKDTRVGIYVGPWVLDLAGLEEDGRHQHVQLRHQLEQLVVREMFQGKFPLAGVSWISFAENSVSISGNNLSRLEKAPDEVLHLIICGVQTD